MTTRDVELGAAELEVLKVLWDEGASTVREVRAHLQDRGRDPAYTTVQTMLTRLEQKGLVVSDKSELAFVYRAKISRERVTRSRLSAIVEQLFDGAAGSLVLQLVKDNRLSADEIRELHQLIDDLDAESPSRTAKGRARRGRPARRTT